MPAAKVETLGNVMGLKFRGQSEIIGRVRKGLSAGISNRLMSAYGVSQEDLAHIIHVTAKTIQRQKTKGTYSVEISDSLVQLADVFARATEVFEDKDEARAWLREESQALGGVSPWSLLDTTPGVDMVIRELGRIEHGVVS